MMPIIDEWNDGHALRLREDAFRFTLEAFTASHGFRPSRYNHLQRLGRRLKLVLLGRDQAIEQAVAAERERCRQLFLAYAEDWHGWKLKSGAGDDVREVMEDIDSGAEVHRRLRFDPECAANHGLPAIVDE